MAPRNFIFSIALGAEYLSCVKSIATFALTFLGKYIILVLGSVTHDRYQRPPWPTYRHNWFPSLLTINICQMLINWAQVKTLTLMNMYFNYSCFFNCWAPLAFGSNCLQESILNIAYFIQFSCVHLYLFRDT